ncbi:MAG: hypothetical protein J6K21_00255 [Bacilli bacterium]|nr:hypothetical protein [Bacilli bacterium]
MFLLECGISIDPIVPGITSTIVTVIKWAIPIILIILGLLDMAKAVIANEEKEMKEAQKMLIKRIIYAVVAFLVVALVQAVFGLLAKADTNGQNASNATQCINCFINNKDCASQ